MRGRIIGILAAVLLLTGCAGKEAAAPQQEAPAEAAAAAEPVEAEEEVIPAPEEALEEAESAPAGEEPPAEEEEKTEEETQEAAEEAQEAEEVQESAVPEALLAANGINPDVYAWMTIPGTSFDTPLVQYAGEDQTYYLSHSAEGAEDDQGALYTENYFGTSFEDNYDVIVFGMNTQDRFQPLHLYADLSYFNKHRDIEITTLEGERFTYRVFAAIVTDDRHPHHTYDFSDPAYRTAYYQDEILDHPGIVDKEAPVDQDSRLLTLMTGTGTAGQRYLVIAYRNEDGEEAPQAPAE